MSWCKALRQTPEVDHASCSHVVAAGVLCLWLAAATNSAAQQVIFDMDTVRHRPGEVDQSGKKVPVGTVALVEGKVGKAVKFSFAGGAPGFMTAAAAGNEEWDRAEGFSFYVKGDGSTNCGGLELIDRNDYGLRYGYCFPIESTEWQKVVVRWTDLIPELAAPLINPQGGYSPSKFGNFWFGKWFYWRDYPAHSYAIDQVVLEPNIPAPDLQGEPGLKRFRASLTAKKPVTIVTMGDSLTDKRHWANRQFLWPEELAAQIEAKYGSKVTLVNPAIGGTTLSQNLVLTPRWLRDAPKPDLVTVWFGGNDWDSGVKGERFREYLAYGVDRLRRQTGGSADILLLTTCPGFKRWDTTRELEQAVEEVAKQKHTALVDIAGAFRKAGTAEQALQKGYWAWDNVHLGTNGHKLIVEAIMQRIEAGE